VKEVILGNNCGIKKEVKNAREGKQMKAVNKEEGHLPLPQSRILSAQHETVVGPVLNCRMTPCGLVKGHLHF
jgi:hypothetical protein